VDRHIRRLDDDLAKYEEEQMTGPRVALSMSAFRDEPRSFKHLNSMVAGAQSSKPADKRSSNAAAPANDASNKKRKIKDKNDKVVVEPPTPKKDKSSKSSSTTASKTTGAQKKDSKKKGFVLHPSYKINLTLVMMSSAEVVKVAAIKLAAEELPIDPNEPRYCICQQVSYGEMIGVSFVIKEICP
ncbi:hypothetical protein HDV05_002143, partial [Chytridiales sp. JEL 0842]